MNFLNIDIDKDKLEAMGGAFRPKDAIARKLTVALEAPQG